MYIYDVDILYTYNIYIYEMMCVYIFMQCSDWVSGHGGQ